MRFGDESTATERKNDDEIKKKKFFMKNMSQNLSV